MGIMRARTTEWAVTAPSAGQLIAALAAELQERFRGDGPAIASALQWPTSAVRTLMRGGMSARWRLLFGISRVALALGRPRDALVEEMARSFIPSSCVIGRALTRTIASQGLPLAVVMKRLGLSEGAVTRLLLGRTLVGLPASARAALARLLELPELRVQQLIQESLTRRRMPTRDLALIGPVRSLAEALHDAFDLEGLTQTEWVQRHHFSNHWIRSLVIGHQPRTPQRSLVRLAAALGLEERQVLAGLRLNQPFPPPPHAGVFTCIAERTAGDGYDELSRAFAMTRPGVERLCARQDLSRTSSRTMHRIRRWLGLSWREFVALASSPTRTPSAEIRSATSFTPVDHGELVMIRLWRKATAANRALALQALRAHAGASFPPSRVAEQGSSGAAEPGCDAQSHGRHPPASLLTPGGARAGRLATEPSLPGPGRPLCELLFEACDQAQETPTLWGRRHHLSLGPTRDLLVGEQVLLGSALQVKFAAALGLTPEAVSAGIAANTPLPPAPHHALFAEVERRIAGRPTQLIAREMLIARSSYDRMVDLRDLQRVSAMTIHRLRLWMGWSWEALVRHAAAAVGEVGEVGEDEFSAVAALPADEREDQEELALIRCWRRARPAGQDQALELLAGVVI
jgi:transcriptional regulator with XRE-family HTH domain